MTTIITSTETLTTMPIEAFGAWLERHGLTVVKAIKGTWPPKVVCVLKEKGER